MKLYIHNLKGKELMKTTLGLTRSWMCTHSTLVLKTKRCLKFIEVHKADGSTRIDLVSFNSEDEKLTVESSTNVGDEKVDGVAFVNKNRQKYDPSDT